MCVCVGRGGVCTGIYMHACRVHACVMPYPGLAVNSLFSFLQLSLRSIGQ